jgi:transcriptional regulator with GAF, ATPase, and Fis domain/Tfp pilus assembly protein PilF
MREVPGIVGCVGRDAELQELQDLHRQAREDQRARLAALVGPAGIGKSKVLSAFRTKVRLSGGVVLEGRCEPGVSFAPFTAITSQALRFLDEVGRPFTADLSPLRCAAGCHMFWHQHRGQTSPADGQDFSRSRERFFDGMAELLRAVASVRTPVVMLHELGQADHGTLELLRALLDVGSPLAADLGHPLPLLFVTCARSDAQERLPSRIDALLAHEAAQRIRLGALDEAGVRALLAAPESVARILDLTGGSPDAIHRLLEASLPSHEEHVQNVLHALSETARLAVCALAVRSAPTSYQDLELAIGRSIAPELRRTLEGLSWVESRTSHGHHELRFARETEKKTIIETLTASHVRELHAGWLRVLDERGADAEARARHALLAGAHERAVALSLEAARTLLARHAPHEAAELLEGVLEVANDAAPVLRLRSELVGLYRATGDYRRGLNHARKVLETGPADAEAHRTVADLLVQSGDLEQAQEALRTAHRLLEGADDAALRAEVEALMAEVSLRRGEHEGAELWAKGVMQRAESDAACTHAAIAARNTLGKLLLSRGESAAAALAFERNRDVARDAALPSLESQALTNLGFARLDRRRPLEVMPLFEQALAVAECISDTRRRAVATEALAVCAHLARDYGKAREYYQSALLLLRRVSAPSMVAGAAANLGELYLSLGEVSRAHSMCQLAAQLGGARMPPTLRAEGLLLRGRVAAARGDTAEARAAFEAARGGLSGQLDGRSAELSIALAELNLDEGDLPAVHAALAELSVPLSEAQQARLALLSARTERAAGGDSLTAAERALRLSEASGDDELRVPAYALFARALLDAGQPHAARNALDQAFRAERRLTATVPPDLLPAWTERRDRLELERLARRVGESPATRINQDNDRAKRPYAKRETGLGAEQLAQWAERYPKIIGRSERMCDVLRVIDRAGPSDLQVLVRGESGSGKELVAEALHHASERRDRPFVRMNCAAIVETLLLSELFGHERGAFTGAAGRRKGRFEVAHGGTLFLDEIGDISPATQAALLRVLQEGEFERVGGTQTVKVDVRIIAATHRDLEAMVRAGTFREDLYYRLRGITIEMPALRDRADDIPEIAAHLLRMLASEQATGALSLTERALSALSAHRWPGNVRELDNVLRNASLFSDHGVIDIDALSGLIPVPSEDDEQDADAIASAPLELRDSVPPGPHFDIDPVDPVYDRIRGGQTSLFEMKKQLERECILRALNETQGNITRAATLLGMKRPRLSQLVKEYELGNLTERA